VVLNGSKNRSCEGIGPPIGHKWEFVVEVASGRFQEFVEAVQEMLWVRQVDCRSVDRQRG